LSVLIFTDNPGVPETRLVFRELQRRGVKVRYLAPWDIHVPAHMGVDARLVYVPSNMLHRGSTFELIHRLLILRGFEQGATVINPVDSMLQYSKEHLIVRLKGLGLPCPETLVTENVEEAYEFAAKRLDEHREVVLKPICKARGIGVTKLSEIRSRADLLQFLSWYNREHAQGVYYLQEFIPNHGYDVRCLVVDGEVVGREKRFNPDDFRYNVAAGGSAEAFGDGSYDELSVKAAEAVGLNIAGIDILPSKDGTPYILEANCFPGYKALMDATHIQVHERIVDYFQRLLRE
jgi:RimK family alpha-L-glutamate ligase